MNTEKMKPSSTLKKNMTLLLELLSKKNDQPQGPGGPRGPTQRESVTLSHDDDDDDVVVMMLVRDSSLLSPAAAAGSAMAKFRPPTGRPGPQPPHLRHFRQPVAGSAMAKFRSLPVGPQAPNPPHLRHFRQPVAGSAMAKFRPRPPNFATHCEEKRSKNHTPFLLALLGLSGQNRLFAHH
jgi:hypothetical protein